eukprot:8443809-Pyramimonas_sp.AAC.1
MSSLSGNVPPAFRAAAERPPEDDAGRDARRRALVLRLLAAASSGVENTSPPTQTSLSVLSGRDTQPSSNSGARPLA